MDCRSIWKRGISLLLVLLLLLAPVAQVSAEELSGEEGENIVAESEAAEVPEENDSSGETEVPDEPEASHETEAPEETETPNETEPPEETEAPDETESPEETEAPRETELPKETEASNEAEVPGETEIPDETEVPEETEPPEKLMKAALWSMPPVRTIAEVLGLNESEDILTTEGTVVLAGGTQAVLQDDTGGIRLAFCLRRALLREIFCRCPVDAPTAVLSCRNFRKTVPERFPPWKPCCQRNVLPFGFW